MSIVFFCQGCGSRFDIDARMAGKRGRCKKCGGGMTVPNLTEPAAKAARPERVAVGAGAGGGKGPASSWLGEVDANDVALAPLTIDRMPGLKKPSMFAEDDMEDSKPYVLAQPEGRAGGRPVSQVSGLKIFWRRRLGFLEKVFRWMNQTAYLLSVPFLMVLLLGILVRNRPMSHLGAVVVVALNIARLVTGIFNVVVVPFRDGIDWKRLKKPIRRVIEPAITIGLVGLAFAFFPWLSKNETSGKAPVGRYRSGVESFERKLEDVVEKSNETAKELDRATKVKKP